jgi:hypothetical protein
MRPADFFRAIEIGERAGDGNDFKNSELVVIQR